MAGLSTIANDLSLANDIDHAPSDYLLICLERVVDLVQLSADMDVDLDLLDATGQIHMRSETDKHGTSTIPFTFACNRVTPPFRTLLEI